jgi:FMN-dependent NADH-azoreductase
MSTLLKIDSSPRRADSVSRQLTTHFVTEWKQKHSQGRILERDLYTGSLPLVDETWIAAAYTPPDSRTAAQKSSLAVSDSLIDELLAADEYVIGLPMYNFSIPAALKLWIDQIVRVGRTFSYGEKGPAGLLLNKRVSVLVTSGGAYREGTPYAAMNFIEPYLRGIFGFLGITNVTFIWADGLSQVQSGGVNLDEYLKPTRELVARHAVLGSPAAQASV